jgi:hypothetical protein
MTTTPDPSANPPRHPRPPVGRTLLLVLAMLAAGCQAQRPPRALAQDSQAAEAALLARIRAEVGDAACSSDAQCRTLPIGAKACGGPASWMAWSTANADAGKLQDWSAELAALQRRRFAAGGIMSTCSIVPDPGATCQAGHCVLRARHLGS